jgi:hypothetical protein
LTNQVLTKGAGNIVDVPIDTRLESGPPARTDLDRGKHIA